MSTLLTILWGSILVLAGPTQGIQNISGRANAPSSLTGTTKVEATSEPLAFATVSLLSQDELPLIGGSTNAGLGQRLRYQATSDERGRFYFANVAPGQYDILVEREGYLQQDLYDASNRTNQDTLSVTSGQSMDGIIVTLKEAGAISGVIRDPFSEPLVGVSVSAYRVEFTPRGRQLALISTVLSREGGAYRLFGLPRGYYYVAASYSNRSLLEWKSRLILTGNLSKPDDGFSTVYFPGSLKISDARPINLSVGSVQDANITFKETQFFSLKIRLVLPPPPPSGRQGLVNPRVALLPSGTDLETAQDHVVQGNGSAFQVERLAEGEYVLVAIADFLDETGKAYAGAISEATSVLVNRDMDATVVALEPFDIFGNIRRFVGTTIPAGMRVKLIRVGSQVKQTHIANVNASGQFRLRNIGPGNYDVLLQGMPRNAYLWEVQFPTASQNLLQIRIDADVPSRAWVDDKQRNISGWVSDVAMTISYSGGSRVDGRVTDASGKGISGAQIVLVPMDPVSRLRKDRYGVRLSDASGTFQLQGIPPGAYTAFAFEQVDPEIYFDPEFNAQIISLGRNLIVTNGINRPMDQPLMIISKEDLARHLR